MIMDLKSVYTQAGNDYDGAINRTAGDEELLLSLLDMFKNDANWTELNNALKSNDVKAAFAAAHALKGSCGMLGMKGLFSVMQPMTEALRSGELSAAKGLLPKAEHEYKAVTELIEQL